MGFTEILTAIITISVLIIIHEFGHYFCAVSTGMKVDRFSVLGIGPVVARLFTYKGTEFVISAIPFGAYVHIVGMEPEDEPEDGQPPDSDPTLFRNRPLWARMLTIVGGPLANYLTASLLIFSVLSIAGNRDVVTMEVSAVQAETAKTAGFNVGDELVKIADLPVTGDEPFDKISSATGSHKGETVAVVVRRDKAEVELSVPISDVGLIGVGLVEGEVILSPASLTHSLSMAVKHPINITKKQLKGLYLLVTGQIDAKVSGPVGIVKEIAKSAEKGWTDLLFFAAAISTLLGLFNLLPLPALDGGRLVFLFYELIARRPANRKVEEMIHGIGMLALLALILYVTIVNDILG